MIIGAGLDQRLGLDFEALEVLGREATDLGFESLWTPSGTVPDAFHVCASWARESRARLGTPTRTGIAVVPAAKGWSPFALALQAATVGGFAEGTFVLGLGTGGFGKEFFDAVGLPDKPIAVMRDFLEITRGLLRGEEVTYRGRALSATRARIGARLPSVPVYLAALGPQMLRLAGTSADGVCLNWATPDQIAESRAIVAAAALDAGRDPGQLPISMYIRVCIDDDVTAARRALAAQVLSYGMVTPGRDPAFGYRGLFTRMGFDTPLRALEARRDDGARIPELVDDAPEELLQAVGYYGPAEDAARHFASLTTGLDEAIVRVVTTAPDPEKVRIALRTLTPEAIRNAA